jgi:signal transduction histidine kinase
LSFEKTFIRIPVNPGVHKESLTMETKIFPAATMQPVKLSLHAIVNQVMNEYLPDAHHHRNSVQNDITCELPISADEEMLTSVLSGMFHAVVSQARNSSIRVMAKTYNDIVLVHVKDSNTCNSYAVASGLARFRAMAEKMGGYLDITSQRSKETTVAFSFPNLPFAA